MLFLFTLLIALTGSALAVPATSLERRHPALAVTEAFRQSLEKRQDSTVGVVSSYQDLLNKAIRSTRSNGQCSSECRNWIDVVTDCATENSSYTQIGVCACGDTPVSAMTTCGECYGGDSEEDASKFSTFCRETLPTISSLSTSSSGPSTSSVATGTRTSSPAVATTGTAQGSGSSEGSGSGAGNIRVGLGAVVGIVGGVAVGLLA
ncbi:uncharacterized protein JCM6883_005653 [Sporobolomyces salmoneus]|uniref:uncharacterized protein n=1 Tax=Sporobolomyces salmoneus TaxID=183962 RepID=UPI00316BEB24